MLTALGEVSMADSTRLGQSSTGARRHSYLFLFLLVGISSVWAYGPIGMAGDPLRGPDPIPCPDCSEPAVKNLGGWYECINGHKSYPTINPGGKEKKDKKGNRRKNEKGKQRK
jgi:hypothetical protein